MYTVSIGLTLISIVCLYSISDKVEVEKKGILLWLQNHKIVSMVTVSATFILSASLLIHILGLATGIFVSIGVWMLLASLMVLFAPFQVIKFIHVGLIILVFTALEILLV